MEHKIGCVLMASGDARRFGENKLNKKLNGKSLIDRALDCIPHEKLHSVVVVTQYQEVIEKATRAGFGYVKNEHPDYGISHTIELGLSALEHCDSVMFMVSDQPLLAKDSVAKMIDFHLLHPDKITSMGFRSKRGNPCIFPKFFYPELYALSEDNGGNSVIREHKDKLLIFEINNPYELTDIDTIADYEKLSKAEVQNG